MEFMVDIKFCGSSCVFKFHNGRINLLKSLNSYEEKVLIVDI